ncbi:MAG: N-methylhydantoinase A/oxoprolinase/acetone carboxylase beta subunit [Cellvibrionaceae bacterium]|jgi:N-methylhydantoinase A/oxoprolinase/acetone carboxylase beta subunit
MSRIGIDVGGTNTDAVILDGIKVLAATKVATTEDVTGGILNALKEVLAQPDIDVSQIEATMIGTTHFINAVIQRLHLSKCAVLRIGLPASASLPPFVDWPADLVEIVDGGVFMVEGGHEFDGRVIMPLDEDAIRVAAHQIKESGVASVAISAIFSPLNPECEERALKIIREVAPNVHITPSHTLGRIGLLERENAAILNAALIPLAQRTIQSFEQALAETGINAPLYITQNDGTVMPADQAIQRPVLSFASGATNSMRGAAALSGLHDCMVVDVGGTTTDIGALRLGFPREANAAVKIGGVRTLFRMPDLLSIGLGGGSHVVESDRGVSVGPQSVGYRLTEEALIFGGQRLTTSDIAVAHGQLMLGEAERVKDLEHELIDGTLQEIKRLLTDAIDSMKSAASGVTLLAVGGGAFLVPDDLPGVDTVIWVENGDVANAVGAAIAQISGEADQVFQGMSRDKALAEAEKIAVERAIAAGADRASIVVVDVEDSPLAYLPGDARRVRTRVVGDLK